MRKILMLLIFFLIIMSIGCDNKTDDSLIIIEDENIVSNDNIVNIVLTIVSDVINLEDMEEIYIRNIDNTYYLVGYQEEDCNYNNLIYIIVNVENRKIREVEREMLLITDIRVEDEKLYFYNEGNNIINGFKDFPSKILVDLETGECKKENIYNSLKYMYSINHLGSYHNETKLVDIKFTDNSIKYHFGATKDSILAGGMFCPNIKIISFRENALTVDIEGLVIVEGQVENLVNASFINQVVVSENIDAFGKRHNITTFILENVSDYTCEFEQNDEGYMDLIIMFK